MTIFGTSLTSSSYSCVRERERERGKGGTLRGATRNRYDMEGDWREEGREEGRRDWRDSNSWKTADVVHAHAYK